MLSRSKQARSNKNCAVWQMPNGARIYHLNKANTVSDENIPKPSMSLCVNKSDMSVELFTDTSIATYSTWIPGEGGDIALKRCLKTGRCVGVCLPLLRENITVLSEGEVTVYTMKDIEKLLPPPEAIERLRVQNAEFYAARYPDEKENF